MGVECENRIRGLLNLKSICEATIEAVRDKERPELVESSIKTIKGKIKESKFIPKDEKKELLEVTKSAEGKIKDLKSPRIGAEAQQRTWENLEEQVTSLGNSIILDGPEWVSNICQRK